MSETLLPVSDTLNPGSWVTELGGSSNLYDSIDSEAGGETYIVSPLSPSSAVYVCKLAAPTGTPGTGTWLLSVSLKKLPNATAEQVDATIEVYEAYVSEVSKGTLICTLSEIDTGETTQFEGYSHTLSAGEIATVTDAGDLYLRITANAP